MRRIAGWSPLHILVIAVALPLLSGGCRDSELTAPVALESVALVAPATVAQSADGVVHSMGLNVHVGYFETVYGRQWSGIIKPKLAALGIRHLRDAGTVVSDDAWMASYYGRLKELAALGMKFDLVMTPPQGSSNYSNVDHFTRLMSYAGPVVENFEGLNEPDVTGRPNWAAETRSFQQALFARVKSDPRTLGMPVFGPSLGRPSNAALVGDLSPWFNYGAIHPYPGGSLPLANLGYHEQSVHPMTGTRRFVATESGYHTAMSWTGAHPPVSEGAMARYVPRLFLEYYQAGLPRTYLYELIDQGWSTTAREQRFGLLRPDGSEKPAYRAVANLIALLNDRGSGFTPGSLGYSLSGDTTGVKQLLLQKRDGRFYLALWRSMSSYDVVAHVEVNTPAAPLTVTFFSPVTATRQFWPSQSLTPVGSTASTGQVNLLVKDQVLLLEVTR